MAVPNGSSPTTMMQIVMNRSTTKKNPLKGPLGEKNSNVASLKDCCNYPSAVIISSLPKSPRALAWSCSVYCNLVSAPSASEMATCRSTDRIRYDMI